MKFATFSILFNDFEIIKELTLINVLITPKLAKFKKMFKKFLKITPFSILSTDPDSYGN